MMRHDNGGQEGSHMVQEKSRRGRGDGSLIVGGSGAASSLVVEFDLRSLLPKQILVKITIPTKVKISPASGIAPTTDNHSNHLPNDKPSFLAKP